MGDMGVGNEGCGKLCGGSRLRPNANHSLNVNDCFRAAAALRRFIYPRQLLVKSKVARHRLGVRILTAKHRSKLMGEPRGSWNGPSLWSFCSRLVPFGVIRRDHT
jgi:hypothetical protein